MSKLTEQNLPAEDLSDLSAPVRGAGLAGLVNGNPPTAPASPDHRVAETPVDEPVTHPENGRAGTQTPTAPAAQPGPRPGRRGPGRPRTRVKPVSAVYVSPGVKERFEAYRHKHKSTNLQVVLQAISAKHGQLPEIIQDSRYSTAPVNELFPADPSAVRYLGGGSVQIAFSPTPEQEEVIDRIGRDLGFETRSTWIAPVLNAFLPPTRSSRREAR
jgi:hypothetical protein